MLLPTIKIILIFILKWLFQIMELWKHLLCNNKSKSQGIPVHIIIRKHLCKPIQKSHKINLGKYLPIGFVTVHWVLSMMNRCRQILYFNIIFLNWWLSFSIFVLVLNIAVCIVYACLLSEELRNSKIFSYSHYEWVIAELN